MKTMRIFRFLMFVGFTAMNIVQAQTVKPFSLPENFQFDYQVDQKITGSKGAGDSCTASYFYTKSGDYAAARMTGKAAMKGNLMVVLTREGNMVFFNDRKKEIVMVSTKKLMSDMLSLTKYIRMDSLMAHMKMHGQDREMDVKKTGRTKAVGAYTAEEYQVTDKKGQPGTIWITKVDFNGPADYLLSAMGGGFQNMSAMMNGHSENQSIMKMLMQSRSIITEMKLTDSSGTRSLNLQTTGLAPVSIRIPTTGYAVSDYTNMTVPEIFHAEMKKWNAN